jgi:hypothetical protein
MCSRLNFFIYAMYDLFVHLLFGSSTFAFILIGRSLFNFVSYAISTMVIQPVCGSLISTKANHREIFLTFTAPLRASHSRFSHWFISAPFVSLGGVSDVRFFMDASLQQDGKPVKEGGERQEARSESPLSLSRAAHTSRGRERGYQSRVVRARAVYKEGEASLLTS